MVKEFVFTPHIGLDRVRFGMTPNEVRAALGEAPVFVSEVRAQTGSFREQYAGVCLFVDYGRDGRCSAVEVYAGGSVVLSGINLLTLPYRELRETIAAMGGSIKEDVFGIRCDGVGIASGAPDEASPPESVVVYRKGYYDELDAMLEVFHKGN